MRSCVAKIWAMAFVDEPGGMWMSIGLALRGDAKSSNSSQRLELFPQPLLLKRAGGACCLALLALPSEGRGDHEVVGELHGDTVICDPLYRIVR